MGGDVQFGSFNVFNYFTTLSSVNPDARGAATAAQFAIQKSKIVAAINGLGADVVALEEMQNNVEFGETVDTALADLVAGLNDAAGAGTWAYVPTPDALATPGATDVITTAIIYKPALADPVGDSFADTDDVWDIARKPVAQTFDIGGRTVTVIANHLKSKSPPDGGGAEPADGQGFFNAERVAEANRLVQWIGDISADEDKGDDVILLGDFNSYGQEDPIAGAHRGRPDRPRAGDDRRPVHLLVQRRARLARPRVRDAVARGRRHRRRRLGHQLGRVGRPRLHVRRDRRRARRTGRATTTRSCSASTPRPCRSRSTWSASTTSTGASRPSRRRAAPRCSAGVGQPVRAANPNTRSSRPAT